MLCVIDFQLHSMTTIKHNYKVASLDLQNTEVKMSDKKSPEGQKHGSNKMVPEVDAANQKEVDINEEIGKINGQLLLPVPQCLKIHSICI